MENNEEKKEDSKKNDMKKKKQEYRRFLEIYMTSSRKDRKKMIKKFTSGMGNKEKFIISQSLMNMGKEIHDVKKDNIIRIKRKDNKKY